MKKSLSNSKKLIVTIPKPHFKWPPLADKPELLRLTLQRQTDISIKGRSGPIKELEENFLAFLENKRKYAVTFNSGTSALLAAYFAIGLKEDDEVIGPAITYHAALSPLYFLRSNPVLVDVDVQTWCIDPQKIEKSITPKTKAIMVVHQWGHPADMDPILKIAKKYSLKVIEDCSHAHGSKYKGKLVGTFGDIAIFSLQAAKLIFAGEGGILVTNNQEYHDRSTLLGHYRDRSKEEIKDLFYQQFWVTGYGLKLRMSPYNAVTAIFSLKKAKQRINDRKKCLTYLSKKLEKFPEIKCPYIAKYADMGAWYGYKPIFNQKSRLLNRDWYIQELQKEGVEVDAPSSPAFSMVPLFTIKDDKMFADRKNKRTYKRGDFPNAEYLANNALSMPTFTNWPESKIIIDQYEPAFRNVHDRINRLMTNQK